MARLAELLRSLRNTALLVHPAHYGFLTIMHYTNPRTHSLTQSSLNMLVRFGPTKDLLPSAFHVTQLLASSNSCRTAFKDGIFHTALSCSVAILFHICCPFLPRAAHLSRRKRRRNRPARLIVFAPIWGAGRPACDHVTANVSAKCPQASCRAVARVSAVLPGTTPYRLSL